MTEDAIAAGVAELKADNARLRRLLDRQNAPQELRHRLRNTLAMLRVVIRRSAETRTELEGYVAHLEDRLDAIMRAQNAADQHGSVDLHGLIADELYHYKAAEGEQVRLHGPAVLLQPRPAQVMALAVHELAANAVEHGVLMLKEGRTAVDWEVAEGEAGVVLALNWKESGLLRMAEQRRTGFGTTVLQDLLSHELRADTALVLEEDGLRYRVTFPLPERIGLVDRAPGNAG